MIGEKIYLALLTALPRAFRREAQAEMLQVFRDGRRSVRGASARARLRFWSLTTYDLLVTAVAARRGRPISAAGFRRRFPTTGTPMIETLLKDLRFAARNLGRSPGLAAVIIATLALGVGANTAIFSVVDGIMLRPLAFNEPDRLVALWADMTRVDGPLREWLSYPDFDDIRRLEAFEEVGIWGGWGPTLSGAGEQAEVLSGAVISQGVLSKIFAVEPAIGRGLLPEDDVPDAERVVLLSHGLWARRFGADPAVLGTSVSLSGDPYTIVGVMPRNFAPTFVPDAELWAPFRLGLSNTGGRGNFSFLGIARLRSGVDMASARAELDALGTRLEAEYPEGNAGKGFAIFPLHEDTVLSAATALRVLLGTVGFVLLMACVNVANLLLAHATSRQGELAVRAAMGATRARIARQLMSESLLLGIVGGLLGTGLGIFGTRFLVELAPANTPRIEAVQVDARVLAFTLLATLGSVLLFGLLPALKISRTDLHDTLKEGGRSQDGGAQGGKLRSSLVVLQVALALVLVVGAGLLVRTFRQLEAVDPGFRPASLLSLNLNLPSSRYQDAEARAEFYGRLEDRMAALPGVDQVGLISALPLAGFDSDASFHPEGQPMPEPGRAPAAWIRRITPHYLELMDIDLLSGRAFTDGDDAEAPEVLIINETLAQRFFADQDPIGQRITFGDPQDPEATWRRIVGVAENIKHFGIDQESRYAAYLPYAQVPSGAMFAVLRTTVAPESMIPAVRREIATLDPDLAASSFLSMDEMVADSMAPQRFTMTLMTAFAVVALTLAAVGLYGIISYGVGQRMREMGVRVALGAGGREIARLIVGRSLVMVALGAALGLLGSFALTRVMSGLLFGVSPTDPMTFGLGALMLVAAGLLASVRPALRAARVDPMAVLNRQ